MYLDEIKENQLDYCKICEENPCECEPEYTYLLDELKEQNDDFDFRYKHQD